MYIVEFATNLHEIRRKFKTSKTENVATTEQYNVNVLANFSIISDN